MPKGFADYSLEVARSKQIFGYEYLAGEQCLWMTIICMDSPGGSAITRDPLAVGDSVYALDCATGAEPAIILPGWDYLFKEFWVSFDQDVAFEMWQGGGYDDVSCAGYFEAGSKPANIFQIGCSRSVLEDISLPSTLRVKITNLGDAPAKGKVWLACLTKEGTYLWR